MFGKHALFILSSYAITVTVILALVLWIVITYRQRQREIDQIEKSITARRNKADSQ